MACLLLGFAGSAAAQAGPKIGVIDIGKALADTADGKKATADLRSKVEPQQKAFDTRQKEIADLRDQLTKGVDALSAERKQNLAQDIDEKQKHLQRDMQDANENLQNQQQTLLQSMGEKLTAVLKKYAQDNGYTLILEQGTGNNSVAFAAASIDVTADVVKAYDKAHPASTPAHP